MASFVTRLLQFLGLKKKRRSSRKPLEPKSPYTYERDEKGRLIRHGPGGTERLGYDTWHPIDSKAASSRARKP